MCMSDVSVTQDLKKNRFSFLFLFFSSSRLIGNGHKINQLDKSNLVNGLMCDIVGYIYLLFVF